MEALRPHLREIRAHRMDEGVKGELQKTYLKLRSISEALSEFNTSQLKRRLEKGKNLAQLIIKAIKRKFLKIYERKKEREQQLERARNSLRLKKPDEAIEIAEELILGE